MQVDMKYHICGEEIELDFLSMLFVYISKKINYAHVK